MLSTVCFVFNIMTNENHISAIGPSGCFAFTHATQKYFLFFALPLSGSLLPAFSMDLGRSRSRLVLRNQNESPSLRWRLSWAGSQRKCTRKKCVYPCVFIQGQHVGFVAFSDVCRVLVFSFVDLDAPFGLFMFEKSQGRLHGIIVKHNGTVKMEGSNPARAL